MRAGVPNYAQNTGAAKKAKRGDREEGKGGGRGGKRGVYRIGELGRGLGAARGKPRSAIKILTVLNGVSGNG